MELIHCHAEPHPALDQLKQALRSQRQVTDATWAQRRLAMEAMQSQLSLPDQVSVNPVSANGIAAAWIGRDTEQTTSHPPSQVILYLHGGGYVLGSITTHRELMARLAVATDAQVLGIDYRRAPENPYPAAVDDAVDTYRWMLAQGISAHRIVIAGDSAGGGLGLAALLRLREAGDPLPAAAVLLSPWTDLTMSGETLTTRADADPMVTAEGLSRMSSEYAQGREDEPEVSPLFADLSDLPPMLIQVGDAEVLLDDSRRLAKAVEDVNGTARLEVWDQMLHVFHAFPQLPESAMALERINDFLSTNA